MASSVSREAVKKPPALLRRVVARYVRAFAPQRIVLFGCTLKVRNGPGSDVDLLIITDLASDPAFQQRRARQLAADCFPPVDVVFAAPDDVAAAATAKSPFLLSILEHGLVAYSRH